MTKSKNKIFPKVDKTHSVNDKTISFKFFLNSEFTILA